MLQRRYFTKRQEADTRTVSRSDSEEATMNSNELDEDELMDHNEEEGLGSSASSLDSPGKNNAANDDAPEEPDLSLVKEQWTQLGKDNKQAAVIHQMFFHMFIDHPHVRPIWAFARNISVNDADWKTKLGSNNQFRLHCSSVQAAITLVVQNIDNVRVLTKTLEDVGTHHFFYDAYEPHLEIAQDGLLTALRQHLPGAVMPPRLQAAWLEIFTIMKSCISSGIEMQRAKYLAQCVTPDEMVQIREMWARVKQHGLDDAGMNLCAGALQAYDALIKQHHLACAIEVDQTSDVFQAFAKHTIEALSMTIDSYQENGVQGFGNLPNRLKEYVQHYVITDVCPTLVRKAFMEGLINMLTYVLGEMDMSEQVQQAWSKIYRVMEQAIIANIVKY